MSAVQSLLALLKPASVAVIGASDRERSVGAKVARNLLEGFAGAVWFVNPRHREVAGRPAYPTVEALPGAPQLAVICTPAQSVPGLVEALGARGCGAAVIISAGLDARGPDGQSLGAAALAAARRQGMRLIGPNCVGIQSPALGLNAGFAHRLPPRGRLALIAQSGALTTAIVDWACAEQVGFSHTVSLGNALDVDFAELLLALAADSDTDAVLLYIESIHDGAAFIAAAREAARRKPVIAIKAGRAPEGARAAASHTGALAGADDVYDAALRRAGVLRVDTLRELFDAAEQLSRGRPAPGERLAIVTNGGGPAILATDALMAHGGALARLAPATLEALDAVLPPLWSKGNPVDIGGDAPPRRYADAVACVAADPNVDALLLIHAPTAIVPAAEIAAACVEGLRRGRVAALSCWMGGEAVRAAADAFSQAGLAVFETPEEAVDGFLQSCRVRRLRESLADPGLAPALLDAARVRAALPAGAATPGGWLSEPQAKALLAAAGIDVVPTHVARSAEEAAALARQFEGPYVLKVLSPDILHKSDVGGVALDLADAGAVRAAAQRMSERVARELPAARVQGFTVQPMIRRPLAQELIAGIASDPTFGRFALFGAGGVAVQLLADRAIDLLPLTAARAAALIDATRVRRLLQGYRDRPAVNRVALEQALLRLSLLAEAIPRIVELDINPLLADAQGVIALDARIRLADDGSSPA